MSSVDGCISSELGYIRVQSVHGMLTKKYQTGVARTTSHGTAKIIMRGSEERQRLWRRIEQDCHPRQRPRWQVDKEVIGLSRVQHLSSMCDPPS